jgi:predicted transcriptional regulator
MKPSEQEQVRVTVRVPTDLVTALEQIAEREERTVSAEIRRLIRLRVNEFSLRKE